MTSLASMALHAASINVLTIVPHNTNDNLVGAVSPQSSSEQLLRQSMHFFAAEEADLSIGMARITEVALYWPVSG